MRNVFLSYNHRHLYIQCIPPFHFIDIIYFILLIVTFVHMWSNPMHYLGRYILVFGGGSRVVTPISSPRSVASNIYNHVVLGVFDMDFFIYTSFFVFIVLLFIRKSHLRYLITKSKSSKISWLMDFNFRFMIFFPS